MKKVVFYTLAAVVLLVFSSCATIFTGTKKRISIDANIETADKVTIDGRAHRNVTFPLDVKVKKGFQDTFVTAEAEGYDKTSLVIDKKFNAVSVLNLLGILGWGIDAATGAMMKPEYNFYELEFEPSKK